MSTAKWANIGDDPGSLHALVERITEHTPVVTIDYIWLFPARRIAIGESIVVVIGAFDDDPDRRRVSTAHFTVSRNKKGAATVNARFVEHGSAPVDAVPRIVQGVLRRLGEDAEASPREEQIGGESARWDELIVELGGAPRTDAEESPAGDTAESAVGVAAVEGIGVEADPRGISLESGAPAQNSGAAPAEAEGADPDDEATADEEVTDTNTDEEAADPDEERAAPR